ncbi:MAG: hypothetical protein CMD55_00935 [Gammaproteobacteria bacterium]|jgi:high-affinity nickel permease|nr:hypothetical protein [Gammaproteobacteria bacterium]|tara:strand:- start:4250 stop:4573 length:324 start_codon:yes stop_codon:yes gene_type:complete
MDTLITIRDSIIIFGTLIAVAFLTVMTVLTAIIFIKIRRILNFIESSIVEIGTVKNKISETIPKPIINIVNSVLTVKGFVDTLLKTDKSKKKKKASKNKKKGENNVE